MHAFLQGAQVYCVLLHVPVFFHREPTATMKQREAMVVVSQHCTTCGDNAFSWRSQPLSFGLLMAGASISKVLLVMTHMGLHGYSARTFFVHQKNFLFLVILNYWEQYRASLVGKCCLEWGWAVWFNGAQCQIWCLYHGFQHYSEGGALRTTSGKWQYFHNVR